MAAWFASCSFKASQSRGNGAAKQRRNACVFSPRPSFCAQVIACAFASSITWRTLPWLSSGSDSESQPTIVSYSCCVTSRSATAFLFTVSGAAANEHLKGEGTAHTVRRDRIRTGLDLP